MIDRGQKVTTWPTPFLEKLDSFRTRRDLSTFLSTFGGSNKEVASPSDVNDDVNGQVTLGAQVQLYKPEADRGPGELPSLATR